MFFYQPCLGVLQEYKELFDDAGTNPGDKTLEDKFFEHEVYNYLHLILSLTKLSTNFGKNLYYLLKNKIRK